MATESQMKALAVDIAVEAVRGIDFITVSEVAFEKEIELTDDEMDEIHRLATTASVVLDEA